MIFLTGDIHGMTDDPDRFDSWSFPEGEDLCKEDFVIILGDFSMPFDGWDSENELRKLNDKPWTTLFIDGNHENFPYLYDLEESKWQGGLVHRYPNSGIIHLMRGEVYEIAGKTFFVMGGATSIDRASQEPQGLWFPEEVPDEYEYERALENLEKHNFRVDFVLTHTCATRHLDAALGYTALDGYGIMTDELTDYLDTLEEELKYEQWFFGHFHSEHYIDDRHTTLYQSIVDIEEF